MHQPCGLVKQHMVLAQDLKLNVAHAEGGAVLDRYLRKGGRWPVRKPAPPIAHRPLCKSALAWA